MGEPNDRSIVDAMDTDRSMLRSWCICFALTALSVAIAYHWIDRPLAFFVHDNFTNKHTFILMQRIPDCFPLLSALLLVWCALLVLARRPFSYLQVTLLLCSVSFIASRAVNQQLKFVFGRTWPETWINHNPSLISSGAYGFNPFHDGPGFASFPSGHTAAVCSVMTVLWFCYPRFRAFYAVIVVAVVIGLLGADYHFLSDIIAGGFVGASASWVVTATRAGLRSGGTDTVTSSQTAQTVAPNLSKE
jgi:membrane-associated phospholipid phosphatase